MLAAIIDTNVFVKALIGSKTCRPILEAFIQNKFNLVTNRPLIEELLEVISRPYLCSRIKDEDKTTLLSIIDKTAEIITPIKRIHACRDTEDNFILESCIAKGSPCVLVTSDKDLLVLNPFHNIRIIPPEDFLNLISAI